jgi:WD40 repeat protein
MKGSSLLVVGVINSLFLSASAGGCSRQTDTEPAPPDAPKKTPAAQILAPTELPVAVGELRRFDGHSQAVVAVAISADGRKALSGSADQSARLWDVETGKELQRYTSKGEPVTAVAFMPDGKHLLTGGSALLVDGNLELASGAVHLWDAESATEIRHSTQHDAMSTCVAFSKDCRRALIGSGKQREMRLMDIDTFQDLSTWGSDSLQHAVALSADGRKALAGTGYLYDRAAEGLKFDQKQTLQLRDLDSNYAPQNLEGHKLGVICLVFSSDDKYALSGSVDKTARLWDIATGQQLRVFEGHGERVLSVAFAPDGKRILTGSRDKTIRLWDVQTGKELHRFEGHTDAVTCVVFVPDGRRALSASRDTTLRLWGLPKEQ